PAPVAPAPVPALHPPDRPAPAPAAPARAPAPAPAPAAPARPAFQAPSDPAPPVRLLPERPASPSSHGVMASAAPVPEPDFVVERSSGEPLVQRLEETKPMPGVETNEGSWDMGGVMPAAAQVEGIDLHRAAEPAHEPEGDLPNVDLPLIMPEETAQRSRSLPAGETPAPPPSLGPAAPSRQAGGVLADGDGGADRAALSQAEP